MSDTNYLGLMIITSSTVAKIMLCAIAGMVVSRYFSARELSEKGLSYISVQVFLPCLLFSNLCLNVTMDDVKRYYWAPILACIPVVLGLSGAMLLSPCNAEKYRGLLLLGSSFQNGLTFPLSIIVNLKGISWFGAQEAQEAQRYIFLYNIICSIGLWAIGDPLIAFYKSRDEARLKADKASQALALRQAHEHGGVTNHSFDFPYTMPRENAVPEREGDGMAMESPRKRVATAHEQLHWYLPHAEEDLPIVVTPTAAPRPAKAEKEEESFVDVRELHEGLRVQDEDLMLPPGLTAEAPRGSPGRDPAEESDAQGGLTTQARPQPKRQYSAIILRAVQSRPVFVSLLALVISLVPPLRWCAQTFPGKMLLGGFTIVGNGAIPLQLLVLGCNVVSSRPKPVETPAVDNDRGHGGVVAAGPAEAAAEAAGQAGAEGEEAEEKPPGCFSCLSMESMFMVCSIGVRMFAIPCISFLVIHLMRVVGILPNERPFLLAMLVSVNSPSAINSALICSMHDYHARVYSQMIFFMYITSIFTATIGLFFFILYLN